MENMTEQQKMSVMRQDDEMEIDLREIFYLLLAKWKSIFLAMLIGAVIFGAYHVFLVNPSYQADASIYITNTDSMITFSDLQLSSALTEDYTNIIKSRTVLNRVIKELGLELNYKTLKQLISVGNPDDSHIITIKVTCDDPELSRDIANALTNISIEQIYQIIGSSEPTIIDYSVAEAVEDVTPSILKYVMLGAMIGAVIVCGIIILKMLMDNTIKGEEDVEKYLQLPVLVAVPYVPDAKRK